MVTTTEPSAWRASRPVSMVTEWAPYEKVCVETLKRVPFDYWNGKRAPRARHTSTAQAKFVDDLGVPLGGLDLEIVQEPPALCHHLQQATPGGVVALVRGEVRGQPVDPFRQQGDLDLRGSRVRRGTPELADDLRLAFIREWHLVHLTLFEGAHCTRRAGSPQAREMASSGSLTMILSGESRAPSALMRPTPRKRPPTPYMRTCEAPGPRAGTTLP